MAKRDYREVKGLEHYIYNSDTNSGDYEFCPDCGGAFKTSDIEVVDMQDGDYDYGVCPHCGVLLKLRLVPTYYFEPEFCSVKEFKEEACVKLSEEQ